MLVRASSLCTEAILMICPFPREIIRLGRCCTEFKKRASAHAQDQLRDTGANGLPEIAHMIERFDRNCDFGHAAGVVA
jgi:hypothetical protein